MLKMMYNSPQNAHGGIIDLLLISATGTEGLDLKRVRHIHIMEPYWTWLRIRQIIGRGVRNGSHVDLPPEERNVQPYIYLAVPPMGVESASPTTDEELYNDAIASAALNESVTDIYPAVSIECLSNGCTGCRTCNPTDRPLYTRDIHKDILAADPCTAVNERKVTATETVIDGKKYYYAVVPNTPFGYNVWYYNEKISAHMPLRQDDPAFMVVIGIARGTADTTAKGAS